MTSKTRLLSNASANYAGQLVTVVVGVALTPVLIGHLGLQGYGVWVLAASLQGIGGLLDFGVTSSVIRFVAAYRTNDDTAGISRVVSTCLALHLVLGALAGGASTVVALRGITLLGLNPAETQAGRSAVLVAAAGLTVALPLGVLGNVLTGLRRYEMSNVVAVGQALFTAGATVEVLELGGGPASVLATSSVGLALAHLVRFGLARRSLPGLRVARGLVDRRTLREIGGYSVWLFVLDVAERLFYNADALIISLFLPLAAVADYNLGFKPASAMSYLSGPAVAVLMPAAASLFVRSAPGELARLIASSTRLAVAVTLPAVLWLTLWGPQMLVVWVGRGHGQATVVLWAFLPVFLVGSVQSPASTILRGIGRVRALAGVVSLEYLVNVALSIWLVQQVGIVGAVAGTLAPALVNDLVLIPYLACRALGVPYLWLLRQALVGPLLAVVPAALLLGVLRGLLSEPTVGVLLLSGAATVVIFAACYGILGAGLEERAAFRRLTHPTWIGARRCNR